MAETLAGLDAGNAPAYRRNAAALARRLEALERELAERLAPLVARPYLVFHDAYGYFERRFGLRPVGAVTADPARAPGARRVAQLRRLMRKGRVVCLFSEPQFPPRLVPVLIEGTRVRHATLDPLGAGLEPGAELYFTLLRNLAASLARCLAPGQHPPSSEMKPR